MITVSRRQRWQSRHDPSIVVTVHHKADSGLWAVRAPTDGGFELISSERLEAEYTLVTDPRPDPAMDHDRR